MNFDSFIIQRKSIISHHLADVSSENSQILVELEEQRLIGPNRSRDPSFVSTKRESSFFRTGDPDQDPIQVIDVLKTIPQGKFQSILATLFFVSFLATSMLSFNFAFFLIPQAYKCPVDMKSSALFTNNSIE